MTQDIAGAQCKSSNDFYEVAWNERKEFMIKLIESGETHPLRIINQLHSFQRYHDSVNDPNEGFKFVEIEHQKDVVNMIIDQNMIQLKPEMCEFLPTGQRVFQEIPFGDKYHFAPFYYEKRVDSFLIDYCRDKEFDAIIELGSGYGQNLITLYYNGGPKVPYYAGEYSQSGTQLAKLLSSLDPEFDLISFQYDHKNPDLSLIKDKKNVLIFTCHSIEQVTFVELEMFRRLAQVADKVECFHFEPFGFQMKNSQQPSLVDQEHEQDFILRKWNQNLFSALVQAHRAEVINLKYIGKNAMGGYAKDPTSIAHWVSP